MKILLAAVLTAGVAFSTVSVAEARQGCGAGFHRAPNGRCRPNAGPRRVVIAPGLVVGRFYAGRGYWDGRRYYRQRYRYRSGWRYR